MLPTTDGIWPQCIVRLVWRWPYDEFCRHLGLDSNDDITREFYWATDALANLLHRGEQSEWTIAANKYLAWEADHPWPSS